MLEAHRVKGCQYAGIGRRWLSIDGGGDDLGAQGCAGKTATAMGHGHPDARAGIRQWAGQWQVVVALASEAHPPAADRDILTAQLPPDIRQVLA